MGDMKTSQHVIAYFDIIGYRQILINHELDDKTFIQAIKDITEHAHGFAKEVGTYGKNIHVYTFSDNVAICINVSAEAPKIIALRLLTAIASYIQLDSILKYGIFIRGCITQGEVYTDQNFLYGQGIVDATEMEKHNAKVPRVIIDKKLVETAIVEARQLCEGAKLCKKGARIDYDNIFFVLDVNTRKTAPEIKKDTDDQHYVDYLQQFRILHNITEYTKDELLVNLEEYSKILRHRMKKFKNERLIFEKYNWCAEKLKSFLPSIVDWIDLTPDEIEQIKACHFFLEV
ncbi:hypothetical protein [Candidatus Bathycorpusculum sp.]|uniref:hypothetical protein n=1 Tax=Candidatus Bathycorpusculum sp. TaxID=2994959 RepID=UPI002835C933|nr:hypothetical protein [Candidatus Termitimicrobium sp.]